MIEIDYTVEIAAPIDEVWAYLWHIPNWAHLMIGYQSVKVVDEEHSVWTLKGDVGVLSREVDLEVVIDEREAGKFLNFTVNGLTEQIAGGGTFRIGSADPEPSTADVPTPVPAAVSEAREPWRLRLRRRWAEFLFRMISRSTASPRGADVAEVTEITAPAEGGARSRLNFHLEVSPGGPMAPMIELLMSPLLEPAAKDLAIGIRKELEGRDSK